MWNSCVFQGFTLEKAFLYSPQFPPIAQKSPFPLGREPLSVSRNATSLPARLKLQSMIETFLPGGVVKQAVLCVHTCVSACVLVSVGLQRQDCSGEAGCFL